MEFQFKVQVEKTELEVEFVVRLTELMSPQYYTQFINWFPARTLITL